MRREGLVHVLSMGALVLAATLLAGGASAWGGVIVVAGEIRNIDGDGDGGVDDLKIERIFFDVTAGTTVTFDSLVWESTGVDLNGDGELTGFDNWMLLFSGATGLASNDDYSYLDPLNQDGSVHSFDSVIQYTFASAGTYMVTVGQLWYSEAEALQGYTPDLAYFDYNGPAGRGYNNPALDHGDWQLSIRWADADGVVSNVRVAGQVIPEPVTLSILGAGCLALARRRRRRTA